MKNNYYTPDLEDLYVGYECEINQSSINPSKGWTPYIIGEGYENITFARAASEVPFNNIRTPYLTKEQIEAEGWGSGREHSDGVSFKKGMYNIWYYYPKKSMNIYKSGMIDWGNVFLGKCPSINEFRKICKLLSI